MDHLLFIILVVALGFGAVCVFTGTPGPVDIWRAKEPKCRVILPEDIHAAKLARNTLDRYLEEFFNIRLPEGTVDVASNYIVFGTPSNNPVLARLLRSGLRLTESDVGEEGFQIVSFTDGKSHYVVLYGRSPQALKYACQELIFYHIRATGEGGVVEWPLDITMRPEFSYRATYMLPCWSQHDSIDSWRRVLRFNSELTLNRNWFWLDGFPVAGHTGAYAGTPLAVEANIQSLIDEVNRDGMKFYIGGGWLTWHHEQAVGKDPVKGTDYYLQYMDVFKDFSGFYFEPPGEALQGDNQNWRVECESLCALIRRVLDTRPEFEIAIAIGKHNSREYLELMSEMDPKRVYWWWCWGSPHDDNPWEFYPTICEWHTTWQHGGGEPPHSPMLEQKMVGQVTSYDPGMGFGNPWNGYSTLGGASDPRDFHPYTMPYFSHEYLFREKCWNLRITPKEFRRRLGRRLFDADLPGGSAELYLELAEMCWAPENADEAKLREVETFVKEYMGKGTPRNRDTLLRMSEALDGIRASRFGSRGKE